MTETRTVVALPSPPQICGCTDTDTVRGEFLTQAPHPVQTIDHGHGITQVFDGEGNEYWYRNGKFHKDNDLPAITWADGTQLWFRNGRLHRDNDLPAVIYACGTQKWFRNGNLHRDNDLPAIIWSVGDREWYCNGTCYRKDEEL